MQLVSAILILLYPLLMYLALDQARPRWVALSLLLVLFVRIMMPARTRAAEALADLRWGALALLALCALSAVVDSRRLLLSMPAIVSFLLLAIFANSLRRAPIIERFARLQVAVLSPAELRYCRSVTLIWAAFFLINGVIALALAALDAIQAWVLYTGLLSYLLIGILFMGELVVRKWRFRRYDDTVLDMVFQRLFPPRIG